MLTWSHFAIINQIFIFVVVDLEAWVVGFFLSESLPLKTWGFFRWVRISDTNFKTIGTQCIFYNHKDAYRSVSYYLQVLVWNTLGLNVKKVQFLSGLEERMF